MPPKTHSPSEAAQTTNKKKPPCPQGTKAISQRTSPVLLSLEAAVTRTPTITNLSPTITVISETPYSQPDDPGLSSNATTNAGTARRAGRSPSEARKLPEQKPRSPRKMSEAGKPQRGASGGMQGGPRRGRSPITGPALPHAAQAAQTTNKKGLRARRAQKTTLNVQALLNFFWSARRACPLCPSPRRRRPKQQIRKAPVPRRAHKPLFNAKGPAIQRGLLHRSV